VFLEWGDSRPTGPRSARGRRQQVPRETDRRRRYAADRRHARRLCRYCRQMQVSGNSSGARYHISPSSHDMYAAASRRMRPANVRPGNIGQATVIAQAVAVGASFTWKRDGFRRWRRIGNASESAGRMWSSGFFCVRARITCCGRDLNIVTSRAVGLHVVESRFTADKISRRSLSGAQYHVPSELLQPVCGIETRAARSRRQDTFIPR
jgi:hypothetical protein